MSDLIHKPAPKFGNYIPSTECERLLILQEDFNCTRFESNNFQREKRSPCLTLLSTVDIVTSFVFSQMHGSVEQRYIPLIATCAAFDAVSGPAHVNKETTKVGANGDLKL